LNTIDPRTQVDNSPVEEAPREINLAEYWSVIVRRRRVIGLSVGAALAVGLAASVLSRPKYRASALLDIEPVQANVLSGSASANYGTDAAFLPTQIQLLESRDVSELAARKLGERDSHALRPRRSGFFGSRGESEQPGRNSTSSALAGRIRSGLSVTSVRNTNLVSVSFVGDSAAEAADVANAVVEAYVEWNMETRAHSDELTAQFLSGEIADLKGQIKAADQRLLAYGEQKGIASPDSKSTNAAEGLQSLNSDYTAAVADRVAKEARYRELENASAETATQNASSGLVAQLKADQARLEREYAEKLNLYKPQWPAMQQLKTQIDEGSARLQAVIEDTAAKVREAARSDYLTAVRREQSLKQMLQSQKGEAFKSSGNAIEYNNLRTEADTKRAVLDTLLKRQAEMNVLARFQAQATSSARVVEKALPPSAPFRPSYPLNLLLALLLGGGIGLGGAFVAEYVDRSLRTPEQVEQYIGVPGLGVIPSVGEARSRTYGPKSSRKAKGESPSSQSIELFPHEHVRSGVAEAYRALRTSLLLSKPGGARCILVTSAVPLEGKTSTAANLAVVFGQLGRRVLLIDADLHKSRLHEVFHISNRAGLVSLVAENIRSEDVVEVTRVPGVFLIPAGPNSPNPSALLSSDRMTEFLDLARKNFDFVIIDTPPVIPVADALILAPQTDGVVLCVKAGRTPRNQVAQACESLLQAKATVLGVLLNDHAEALGPYSRSFYYGGYYTEAEPESSDPRRESSA
jgi:polysaccharide biosynthesis transport protein